MQVVIYDPGQVAKRRSECPIAFALDIFGDRWTLLVVRDLALNGRRRYSDFASAGEGIATNILASRLELLVDQGIVEKSRDPDHGSRRLYALTDKGIDLLPILVEMIVWSARYDPASPVSDDFLRRAAQARGDLLAELRRSARR